MPFHRVYVRYRPEANRVGFFIAENGACIAVRAADEMTDALREKVALLERPAPKLKETPENLTRLRRPERRTEKAATPKESKPAPPPFYAQQGFVDIDVTHDLGNDVELAMIVAKHGEAIADDVSETTSPVLGDTIPTASATMTRVTDGDADGRTKSTETQPVAATDIVTVQLGDGPPEALAAQAAADAAAKPKALVEGDDCPACGAKGTLLVEHGFIACNADPDGPGEERGCGWMEPVEMAVADTAIVRIRNTTSLFASAPPDAMDDIKVCPCGRTALVNGALTSEVPGRPEGVCTCDVPACFFPVDAFKDATVDAMDDPPFATHDPSANTPQCEGCNDCAPLHGCEKTDCRWRWSMPDVWHSDCGAQSTSAELKKLPRVVVPNPDPVPDNE